MNFPNKKESEKIEVTHKELCEIGAKWLKKHKEKNMIVPNCNLVAIEAGAITIEQPDVIGWCSWCSVLIEVKVSKEDFKRDFKKRFRNIPHLGMGEFRYYLVAKGLIDIYDLPEDWGLLEYDGKGISITKTATRQYSNLKNERDILVSLNNKLSK